MNWQESFSKISNSPIFLEEEQHVYIHKKTGMRYISVTTALELVKNKFDPTIIRNMIMMYEKFNDWIHSQGVSYYNEKELYLKILNLYINYKHFRSFILRERKDGGQYKSYKPLYSYTISDFLSEFEKLEAENQLDRYKHVYINLDGSIMTEEQIQSYWQMTADIANLYGSMVHEIVEEYILLKQRFLTLRNVDENIKNNFIKLKSTLKENLNEINYNAFKEYIIEEDIEDFKNNVITRFNKLNVDLGRICVPERIMFIEEHNLAGMTDVLIDIDDKTFDIGDHKTNKELSKISKYGKKLKPPLSHYSDCNFNLYNLQLSLYSYMYEQEHNNNKKLRNLWISYYSRIEHKFVKNDLTYLKEEVKLILNKFDEYVKYIVRKFQNRGLLDGIPINYHMHLSHYLEKKFRLDQKEGLFNNIDIGSTEEVKHRKNKILQLYKNRVEEYMNTKVDIFII